jgi:hypothetical protein
MCLAIYDRRSFTAASRRNQAGPYASFLCTVLPSYLYPTSDAQYRYCIMCTYIYIYTYVYTHETHIHLLPHTRHTPTCCHIAPSEAMRSSVSSLQVGDTGLSVRKITVVPSRSGTNSGIRPAHSSSTYTSQALMRGLKCVLSYRAEHCRACMLTGRWSASHASVLCMHALSCHQDVCCVIRACPHADLQQCVYAFSVT